MVMIPVLLIPFEVVARFEPSIDPMDDAIVDAVGALLPDERRPTPGNRTFFDRTVRHLAWWNFGSAFPCCRFLASQSKKNERTAAGEKTKKWRFSENEYDDRRPGC